MHTLGGSVGAPPLAGCRSSRHAARHIAAAAPRSSGNGGRRSSGRGLNPSSGSNNEHSRSKPAKRSGDSTGSSNRQADAPRPSRGGAERQERPHAASPPPQPAAQRAAPAAAGGAPSSAGSTPEMRKNPDLYSGLSDSGRSGAAPLPQYPPRRDASSSTPTSGAPVGSTGSYSAPPTSPSAAPAGPEAGRGAPAPLLPPFKPEVLSPAGGWPQLRAAVENGADAVYFGLSDFSARARAANFSPEELHEVMQYLRARGVKGYVALNILVFDEELGRLEERVRQIAEAGVDAVIVQDVGAVSLLRRVAPHLPIHGSTQMSITSPEGAEFAASLGVSRIVVGRELSTREIRKVAAGTGAEVEAFCHGALCVSYSGQCFSSESWGGRSANRGQCAQACRMPYGLVVDGALVDLKDMAYLLSPQDLMALEQVPAMIEAGVGCFKIEGRLKGPEYVALTTKVYRLAVDAAWQRLTGGAGAGASSSDGASGATAGFVAAAIGVSLPPALPLPGADLAPKRQQQQQPGAGLDQEGYNNSKDQDQDQLLRDLRQVFARGQDEEHHGLTPGFLEGVRHQRLVRGRTPRHRGVCVGRVARVTARGGVVVELLTGVKRGDGLVFDQGSPESEEEGGSIYDIFPTDLAPAGNATSATAATAEAQRRGRGGPGGGRRGDTGGAAAAAGAPGAAQRRRAEGAAAAGSVVELILGDGQVDCRRLRAGDLIWRTRDHALEGRLRATYESIPKAAARKLPVRVALSGGLGEPLVLEVWDEEGRRATAETDVPLQAASNRAMTHDDVAAAVGQLGDNSLAPRSVDTSGLALDQGLFLPPSAFKSVRRRAAAAFMEQLERHPYAEGLAQQPVLPLMLREARSGARKQQQQHDHHQQQQQQQQQEDQPNGTGDRGASSSSAGGLPLIRVLCRTPGQVEAALKVDWLEEIILDFLEVHGLKEAVAAVQSSGRRAVVALPRILKPDEQRLLNFYLRLRPDALLLRGAGALRQLQEIGGEGAKVPQGPRAARGGGAGAAGTTDAAAAAAAAAAGSGGGPDEVAGSASSGTVEQQQQQQQQQADDASRAVHIPRLEGDFSFNAANALSAHLLLSSGLSRLSPTHDLDAAQLAGLARALGPGGARDLEAIVHTHLPIFHTEHCVFARCLSEGNSFVDCGHPCERHSVHLRDGGGADHLVLADMGCRNTVFNAAAQSAAYHLPRLLAAGYGALRIELLDEPPEAVEQLLDGYRAAAAGELPPGRLWGLLQALPNANGRPGGVGGGSLDVRGERAAASLRPTAATLKQQQQQQQQAGAGAAGAPR